MWDRGVTSSNYSIELSFVEMRSFSAVTILISCSYSWHVFSLYLLQVNTHLTPRPILLTRHGESMDNVRGRIGGDTELRYIFLTTVKIVFYCCYF
jgi:hypothetical protein